MSFALSELLASQERYVLNHFGCGKYYKIYRVLWENGTGDFP
jgi:hypothetical protein